MTEKATGLRKTGIGFVGDMPWGTHFCHFYETKADLLDILIPFFKSGVENNELCIWIVFDPLNEKEAKAAFREAVPKADEHLAAGDIEIIPYTEWYLKNGSFNRRHAINGWQEKLDQALAKGYAGLRLNGNEAWLTEEDWHNFSEYERKLDETIADQRSIIICTYPLAGSCAGEIFDVARTHQFAIAKRHGNWEVIETPETKHAKEEVKKLNKDLEQRVEERTRQLATANEELKKEIAGRQGIEEALRKSRQQYETLVQSINGIVWESDAASLSFIFVSNQAERILGYPLSQWLEEPGFWSNHLHPEDRTRAVNFCRESAARRVNHQLEYRIIAADGSVVWISDIITVNVLEDDSVRLRGIMVDITDRKRIEEALRESEERFRQLAENIDEVFWMTTRNLEAMLYVSPAYEKVWGRTCESLYQKPRSFVEAIHPEDRSQVADVIERNREQGFEVEYRVVRPDSSVRWIRDRGFPVKDKTGSVYRIAGIAEDITERKRNEEAVKASEEHLKLAFDAAQIGTGEMDIQTNQITLTDAMQRVVGVPPGTVNLSFEEWLEIIHPEDRASVSEVVENSINGQPYITLDYRIVWQDESVHWVTLRARTFYDEAGRATRIIGAIMDITERKQMEQGLRESEQLYRFLAENVNDIITLLDTDANRVYASPSYIRTLGWVPKPFEGIHPDDLPSARKAWERALTGEKVSLTIRYAHADGSWRWLELFASLVHYQDKPHVLGLLRDVTERKQAEEALRESEGRLEEAERMARLGYWERNFVTGQPILSDETFRILGVQLEQRTHYLAESHGAWQEAVHPDDRKRVMRAVVAALRGEAQYNVEYRLFRLDGEMRFIYSQGDVIWDESGKPTRMFGFIQDITERRQAEENLLKEKLLTEQIMNSMPGVCYVLDENGQFLRWNENFEQVTGYSSEELVRMSVPDLFADNDQKKIEECIKEVFTKSESSAELELVAKTGEHLPYWFTGRRAQFDSRVCGICMGIDVSEHRSLKEQLHQSQKMEAVGQLAGGVAHDFNNLLTVINGYCELALKQLQKEDPLYHNIEEVHRAGERAAMLTRQLLAFSRKQVLQPKILDLNTVVSDMERMLRRIIGEHIELQTLLEPELGNIKADPGQIEQVVMNLVVNARDAMPQAAS